MKRIITLLLLTPLIFSADFSYDEAISYIKKDLTKITSLEPGCVGFYLEKSDDAKTYYSFELREIHNTKCGGDPETAPRLASVMVYANKKISVFNLMCNSYVDINDYSWGMECPKKKYCIYPYNNPDWPNAKTIASVFSDLTTKCPPKDENGNDLIESYIE